MLLWTLCHVTLLGSAVNAISCYACESLYEPGCGDAFDLDNYGRLDCSRVAPPRYLRQDLSSINATACMKKTYEENGRRLVVRNCFFGDVNDTTIGCRTDPSLVAIEDVDCLVCADENFCNAAERHHTSTVLCWPLLLLTSLAVISLPRPQS